MREVRGLNQVSGCERQEACGAGGEAIEENRETVQEVNYQQDYSYEICATTAVKGSTWLNRSDILSVNERGLLT